MQKGLRQDAPLIRFFGLAGTEKAADICFSKTDPASPKHSRSESVTHGGFDNDVPTMTSVVHRVLDAPDASAVVDYFEDQVPGFERPPIGLPPESAGPVRAVPRAKRTKSVRKRPRTPVRKAARKR